MGVIYIIPIVKDWDLQGMHLYREVRAAELRVSIEEIANA